MKDFKNDETCLELQNISKFHFLRRKKIRANFDSCQQYNNKIYHKFEKNILWSILSICLQIYKQIKSVFVVNLLFIFIHNLFHYSTNSFNWFASCLFVIEKFFKFLVYIQIKIINLQIGLDFEFQISVKLHLWNFTF